ncbi:thiamine transport system ATP-binding protein [Vespertiliibacter pulmonis]|uniref:Thiamine transport system ATP-binding protein n=2 Tax=Vespertiliibacter pulmonis TaxID=1443036 RepID=A0A3N4VLW0_9PAST|nr:thiamine transport system ATP-binding protein [Vespertiliibacter pulmonis]
MDFQLNVKQGERVAIIGESGAGKSTLLNLIAGFDQADSGEICLNGQNYFNSEPAKRPVSMLFQDNNLFPHLTVKQNIGLALVSSLRFNADQSEKIMQIATEMGIDDLLERRADQLSGGQKQRVALARTLLRDKPILLLDEPFSALDPNRRNELQKAVAKLCQVRNLTLIMVTHQFNEVKGLFDYALRVDRGRIVERINLIEF